MSNSPIPLIPADGRLTTYPIARPDIFEYYKLAVRLNWTVEEVSPSVDIDHYKNKLTDAERHFVDHVLAFFAASDGIVNQNLAKRFCDEIPILEVQYVYAAQIYIENVHAETYSILLDAIIPTKARREELLSAITRIPIISKMSDYMLKCIQSDAPFADRLLRMACVEGIFFTGCFCVIYWLQNRGLMPALGHSNELIARDEALHTKFAMHLYGLVSEKLTYDQVRAIVIEAVDIAREFINIALPNPLPEMNAQLMSEYIECTADNLIAHIDLPPIYNSKHSFHFANQINMMNKTNYFERRVSEYSKKVQADDDSFDVKEDF